VWNRDEREYGGDRPAGGEGLEPARHEDRKNVPGLHDAKKNRFSDEIMRPE
jgi:hypothetical protein